MVNVADVGVCVREAGEAGLKVGDQATGHRAAGTLGGDTLLVDTSGLTTLDIDP